MAYLPGSGWRRGKLYGALGSQDPQVRLEALRLLGERGGADPGRVYPMLADADPMVRQVACIMAGTAARPDVVPHLLATLASESDEEVLRYAAWALRRVPEQERLEQVASIFTSTDDARVKRVAALELRQHRYLPVVEELAGRFASSDRRSWRDVDHAAIEDLALLGYYAAEPLTAHLQSNDLRVQVNAALALGRIGDGRSASALAWAMRNIAPEARPSVGVALGELGGDAVAPMAELLEDEDKEVRLTAAQVLGSVGEPAVPVLLEALRRRSTRNLEEVIYALGLTRSPAAFYPLMKTYEVSKDNKVKAWATLALALVCAHTYRQVEERQDLFRALNIFKESIAPHALLDSETMLELGKAFLYCNRFADGAEDFQDFMEKALACFTISQAEDPSSRATLYRSFTDAYLRALRASSKEVLGLIEAGVHRDLGASAYPLERHAFNRSVGVLLSLLREMSVVRGRPEPRHYEAYLTALNATEQHMGREVASVQAAAAVLQAPHQDAGDAVTYQMQDRIDRLMRRTGENPAVVSLLQRVSVEMLKAETGVGGDLSAAQVALKGLVDRMPLPQDAKADLTFKAMEVAKAGMPQVGVVLDGMEQALPRRMGRGAKVALAAVALIVVAVAAVLGLEYLGYINVLPWL